MIKAISKQISQKMGFWRELMPLFDISYSITSWTNFTEYKCHIIKSTQHTHNKLTHILPLCITSSTKYSGKSRKSFGLYNKREEKIHLVKGCLNRMVINHTPQAKNLTWGVQCLYQIFDLYKILPNGVIQPNQFPASQQNKKSQTSTFTFSWQMRKREVR